MQAGVKCILVDVCGRLRRGAFFCEGVEVCLAACFVVAFWDGFWCQFGAGWRVALLSALCLVFETGAGFLRQCFACFAGSKRNRRFYVLSGWGPGLYLKSNLHKWNFKNLKMGSVHGLAVFRYPDLFLQPYFFEHVLAFCSGGRTMVESVHVVCDNFSWCCLDKRKNILGVHQ